MNKAEQQAVVKALILDDKIGNALRRFFNAKDRLKAEISDAVAQLKSKNFEASEKHLTGGNFFIQRMQIELKSIVTGIEKSGLIQLIPALQAAARVLDTLYATYRAHLINRTMRVDDKVLMIEAEVAEFSKKEQLATAFV